MSKINKLSVKESTKYTVDEEMLGGLFKFKALLEKKLVPEKFGDADTVKEEATAQYELEKAKAMCPPQWAENLQSIVLTEATIQKRASELGAEITKFYEGKEIICVGLLTGAVCFMTDLIKYIKVPYELDFMSLSSYGKGTESKGIPKMTKDMKIDPKGKHILLIEDLIDTGRTLAWVKKYLADKDCASVRVCCLLDKKARRIEKHVTVDFVGMDCPNAFIVGYGMDFAGHYRGLPFIGVLKPEAYANID